MSGEVIVGVVVSAVVGLVGFLLKRQLINRTDRIEEKVDELTATVTGMALQNARDHGEVSERIASLEGKMDNIRSPWGREKHN